MVESIIGSHNTFDVESTIRIKVVSKYEFFYRVHNDDKKTDVTMKLPSAIPTY